MNKNTLIVLGDAGVHILVIYALVNGEPVASGALAFDLIIHGIIIFLLARRFGLI